MGLGSPRDEVFPGGYRQTHGEMREFVGPLFESRDVFYGHRLWEVRRGPGFSQLSVHLCPRVRWFEMRSVFLSYRDMDSAGRE